MALFKFISDEKHKFADDITGVLLAMFSNDMRFSVTETRTLKCSNHHVQIDLFPLVLELPVRSEHQNLSAVFHSYFAERDMVNQPLDLDRYCPYCDGFTVLRIKSSLRYVRNLLLISLVYSVKKFPVLFCVTVATVLI